MIQRKKLKKLTSSIIGPKRKETTFSPKLFARANKNLLVEISFVQDLFLCFSFKIYGLFLSLRLFLLIFGNVAQSVKQAIVTILSIFKESF